MALKGAPPPAPAQGGYDRPGLGQWEALQLLALPWRLLDGLGDSITAKESDHVLKAAERPRHDLGDDHSNLWIAEIRLLLKTVTFRRDGIRMAIDRVRLRVLFGTRSENIDATKETIAIDIPTRIRSRGHQMGVVIEGRPGTFRARYGADQSRGRRS